MPVKEAFIVVTVGLVLLLGRRRCAQEASEMHERLWRAPLDPGASEFGFVLGGCAYIVVGLLSLVARI